MIGGPPDPGTPQWSELLDHIFVSARARADLWDEPEAARSDEWLIKHYYRILTPDWARDAYGREVADDEFAEVVARRIAATVMPSPQAGPVEQEGEEDWSDGAALPEDVVAPPAGGPDVPPNADPAGPAAREKPEVDPLDVRVGIGILLFLFGVGLAQELPLGATLKRLHTLRALHEWSDASGPALERLAATSGESLSPATEPWNSARLVCPDTDYVFSAPTSISLGRQPFWMPRPGPLHQSGVIQAVSTSDFVYLTLLGLSTVRLEVTDSWVPSAHILVLLSYLLCLGRFLLNPRFRRWRHAAQVRRAWTAALALAILALPAAAALVVQSSGYEPGLDDTSPGLIVDNATGLPLIAAVDGRPVPLLPRSLIQRSLQPGRTVRIAVVAPFHGMSEAATFTLPANATRPCIYNVAGANAYWRGSVTYQ